MVEGAPGGDSFDSWCTAALTAIPSAVALFEVDHQPVWINASMQRLLAVDGEPVDLEAAFASALSDTDSPLRRALRAAADGTATRLDDVLVATSAGVIRREAWVGPLDGDDGRGGAVLVLPAEEERLHPLLANTYDIISVLAADGTIRYSNPAAGKLMSYEGMVLAGSNAIELVHPDERDLVLQVLGDPTSTSGDPLRLRLRFGDGEWHHCLVHVADLLDDPAVGGIVVTVHDITEQVEANDELRRSEQWMRRLLGQLTDVVVVFDASGEITYITPSIETLVGIPEARNVGTDAFETIHPDDLEEVDAVFRALLADEDSDVERRVTFRLRHTEGHYVWVEAILTNALTEPAVRGIIATLRDITQLKQAEQMFRGLVESAPDAMVVVDDSGTVVLANDRSSELFGWPPDELVGQGIDVLVPERLQAHRADFFAAPRSRTMGEGLELMARRRDGTEIPVEVSLSPHETHQGRLVSAAIRDISAQRETRLALERALEGEQKVVRRLEEADALKAEFVSTVAHELKSPLTAISGFARMLERVAPGADTGVSMNASEMAGRITANADRLLDMIEQLLRFSRLEAGSARLDGRDVELQPVVERSIDLLGAALGGHRIEIDIPDGLTVWADEDGIANVLRNLLSNAAKFGPEGTTVWIEAEDTSSGVEISVSDEGPGVAPEDRQSVFDQFHQTSTGRSRGGTGLGLSIARRYVELHNGEIRVDQRPGAGARFTFVLPHGPATR